MKKKLRDGTLLSQQDGQDKLLAALYGSAIGRALLRPLISPTMSRMAGKFLSCRLSVPFIRPFIRANHIDMTLFESETYRSYNDFFTRRIRPEARPIDRNPLHLIAPCDSKLTALPITPESRFAIKHTEYSLSALLKDDSLAARYAGGYALIFRLTVDDYHRYCYVDNGTKSENVHIPGVLHTVNPIANDHYPIYKENSREFSILSTKTFGEILMMEVGAMLVGKIVNHHEKAQVFRGEEKGYFQFGGSTVILLLPKDSVQLDADILENSLESIETVVHMGEKIGIRS